MLVNNYNYFTELWGYSQEDGNARKRRRHSEPHEITSAQEQDVDFSSDSERDISFDDLDLDPTYVGKVRYFRFDSLVFSRTSKG